MTAYTATPLLKKLGIKPDKKLSFHQAPSHFEALLGTLPEGSVLMDETIEGVDFVISFHRQRASLIDVLTLYKPRLAKDGMIWIAWPKASSKVDTDLSREYIRAYFLDNGLVDVKVASIDEVWSALKFVYRLKDR